MPTADDTPTLEPLLGASVAADDVLQIYDVSAGRVKKITVAELVIALDALGLAADP